MNKIDTYVPTLTEIDDDKAVIFNFRCQNINDIGKLKEILKELGLEETPDVSGWLIQEKKEYPLDASSEKSIDIWSPIMTAKEAKEIMPELLQRLDESSIKRSNVLPITVENLLEKIDYEKKDTIKTANFDQEIDKILQKIEYDSCSKDGAKEYWHQEATLEEKKQLCELYGLEDTHQFPEQVGANEFTLDKIKYRYPSKDYVYSGTQVSDDYYCISRRPGRSGKNYATRNINYAKIYDGAEGDGKSATTDKYASTMLCDKNNKRIYIGFINIYEQTDKQKKGEYYYSNFGMDDNRGKGYPFEETSETFVIEGQNPIVAKYVHFHIKEGNRSNDYYININEISKELREYIVNSRKADLRDTFSPDKISENKIILERLQQQAEQLREGNIPPIRDVEHSSSAQQETTTPSQTIEEKTTKVTETQTPTPTTETFTPVKLPQKQEYTGVKAIVAEKLKSMGIDDSSYILITKFDNLSTTYQGVDENGKHITHKELSKSFKDYEDDIISHHSDIIMGSNNGVTGAYFKEGVYVIGGPELKEKLRSHAKDINLGVILSNGEQLLKNNGGQYTTNTELNNAASMAIRGYISENLEDGMRITYKSGDTIEVSSKDSKIKYSSAKGEMRVFSGETAKKLVNQAIKKGETVGRVEGLKQVIKNHISAETAMLQQSTLKH